MTGGPAARHVNVYDGDGVLVGTFADWDAAHDWAHGRVMEPRTRLPVEVEDRASRMTWVVEPLECRITSTAPSDGAHACWHTHRSRRRSAAAHPDPDPDPTPVRAGGPSSRRRRA